MTDTLETFGTILKSELPKDAVHVACISAQAHGYLQPGMHVGYRNGVVDVKGDKIGIVDPFLAQPVQFGQFVWIFLYPRTVTGLRHEWEHPSIALAPYIPPLTDTEEPLRPEVYLRKEAELLGLSYAELMQGAREYSTTGKAWYTGDEEIYLSDDTMFWEMYRLHTGEKVNENHGVSFFRCAC